MKITSWPKTIFQRMPFWLAPIFLGLFAYLPILSEPGVINTGDSAFLLVRLHQLVLNLRNGTFPVRWMPDAAYGLGYPFFNFYASLPYYVAGLFNLLGFGYVWSLKLTQILGFAAATVFAYLLAKHVWASKAAALLTALAYTYAPFHLIQIYVRGDALSEFYAFAFYPLILLALLRLRQKPSFINTAFLALAYGGLILSHNISALVFSPFVALYALFLAAPSKMEIGSWKLEACPEPGRRVGSCKTDRSQINKNEVLAAIRFLLAGLAGIGLGLALSAWFWLPALLEGKWVHLERMTSGYLHYSGHFRSTDLIQWKILFDYHGEASPYAMGAVQTIFAMAGTASILIWWTRRRRLERNSAFFLLMLASVTYLITPLSRPLWDAVPLLPFVQFPWRLLAVQALPLSFIIGHLARLPSKTTARLSLRPETSPSSVEALRATGSPRSWRGIIAGALGLALLTTAMLNLPVEYLVIDDVTREQVALYEYFTAYVGTTSRNEYQPRWVEPGPFTSAVLLNGGKKPPPLAVQGKLSGAKLVAQGPTKERWLVDIASPQASLAFHTYYFPGWQGYVDGRPVETQPIKGLGYIGLAVSQGPHQVLLRLERTPPRAFGEGLSLLALILIVGLLAVDSIPIHPLPAPSASPRPERDEGLRTGSPYEGEGFRGLLERLRRRFSARDFMKLAVALTLLLSLALFPRLRPRTVQEGAISDLALGFKRAPYPHHNPRGIPFENGVRLRGYQLSAEEVKAGQTITVTLYWEEAAMAQESNRCPEAVVRLVLPAAHLFQVPYIIAEDEAPLEPTTIHRLEVPVESVRGIYFVSVGLRDAEGPVLSPPALSPSSRSGRGVVEGSKEEIAALSEGGERLDILCLSPVRLRSEVATAIEQPFDSPSTDPWSFGPRDKGLRTRLRISPALADFGQGIVLVEADAQQESPQLLRANLVWQAAEQVPANYVTSLRLKDAEGYTVASLDAQPLYGFYPTSLWRPGELVYDRRWLPLPEGMPPGDYSLEVILYDVQTLQPLGRARVEKVTLMHPTVKAGYPIRHRFPKGLAIAEANVERTRLEQGENLPLTVKWAAVASLERDYSCLLKLEDERGKIAQKWQQPLVRSYPTSRWPVNALVLARYNLRLSHDLPPGHYHLVLAPSDALTGEELGEFDVETIEVIAPQRHFTVPEMERGLGMTFGREVLLLGYNLAQEGQELRLGLYWQALRQMEADYKVFVHLFDPATETIVAQRDAMPREGRYPTSRWAEGEVVSDSIILSLAEAPPGRYRLAVGVYHPETMERLPAVDATGLPVRDNRVVLAEEIEIREGTSRTKIGGEK